jgi:hypothetical protein
MEKRRQVAFAGVSIRESEGKAATICFCWREHPGIRGKSGDKLLLLA